VNIQELGVSLFLVAILIAGAVILAPASMRAREAGLPAVPDLPNPAVVGQIQDAADVAGTAGQVMVNAIDVRGAARHALDKHGQEVVSIFEALQAGTCSTRVFVENPENRCLQGLRNDGRFTDGQKGYAVCNLNGKLGLVPIRYDAINGIWHAMTAFYTDQGYLDEALQRDNCHDELDLARLGVYVSFWELLKEVGRDTND